jgi:CIC family chloride channel protein
MGAVFAGTARVPLATLIMVAEMTGGYGLIVPSMLASSLSFMVQRTLTTRARYPCLYEAQVEARVDSPAHHVRLLQGAFRILEKAGIQDLRGVSFPDLNNLLRFGQPIAIHGGKGRIFTITITSPDSPLVGHPATEVNGAKGGIALIAVLRGEEVLPPGHGGPLEQGDTLIIAAGDQAYAEFMQRFGQSIPGEGEPDLGDSP